MNMNSIRLVQYKVTVHAVVTSLNFLLNEQLANQSTFISAANNKSWSVSVTFCNIVQILSKYSVPELGGL